MKKYVLGLAFLLASGYAFAQLAGTDRLQNNLWLPADKSISFGTRPNAVIRYDGTNLLLDVVYGGGKVSIPDGINAAVTGNVTGNVTGDTTGAHNGTVGATTPASGAFTNVTLSGTIQSSSATGLGFVRATGANTACNTTCGISACVTGVDTDTGAPLLNCTDATADVCLCAGPTS